MSTSEIHEEVARRLDQAGQRYTRGRRRLIDTLLSLGRPVTIREIVENEPELAQSSAYRNLDVLQSSGAVRRLPSPGDFDHFELSEPILGHHHHLICLQCGSIADMHLPDEVEEVVDQGLAAAAHDAGFFAVQHSLDLHGYCAGCSAPAN
jgi:Fe2+ or Zn2+ uptake regulation protein